MTLAELVEEFLSHLNSSPGSFENDIEHIANMLNSWVTTEETLQELVELLYTQVCVSTHTRFGHLPAVCSLLLCFTVIFKLNLLCCVMPVLQSTVIPNFSYTGARLCNFLSHNLALSPASGNFRQLLLKRWALFMLVTFYQVDLTSTSSLLSLWASSWCFMPTISNTCSH